MVWRPPGKRVDLLIITVQEQTTKREPVMQVQLEVLVVGAIEVVVELTPEELSQLADQEQPTQVAAAICKLRQQTEAGEGPLQATPQLSVQFIEFAEEYGIRIDRSDVDSPQEADDCRIVDMLQAAGIGSADGSGIPAISSYAVLEED